MVRQRGFNFAQLNPKTAQLNLLVATASEFKPAGGGNSRPISGPIEPLTLALDEFLGGKFRPIQITTTNSGAGDVQLARFINRAKLLIFVEHVDVGVRDRPSNRHEVFAVEVLWNAKHRD